MKSSRISLLSTLACAFLSVLSAAVASDKDTLPPSDVSFVKQEAAVSKGMVEITGLGVKKANHADVKAFSEMLAKDHATANEQIAALAKTKGVELSSVIDPLYAATVQRLEKHTGQEFDRALLSEIVSTHKKCIKNFEETAKSTKDADLKKWVSGMIPALKAHLEKAESLGPK